MCLWSFVWSCLMLTFVASPSILKSESVTIIAGAERHALTVHTAALLESESKSLCTLVQPGWRESTDGKIDWSHTELDTVQRVITYLYYKDYSGQDPVLLQTMGDQKSIRAYSSMLHGPEPENDLEAVDGSVSGQLVAPDANKAGAASVTETVARADASPVVDGPGSAAPIPAGVSSNGSMTPNPNAELAARKIDNATYDDRLFPHKRYSYRKVLLIHAEVYAFALYHMLVDLQVLAFNRVAQMLRKIDCNTRHAAGDLTDCIEHIYNETPRTVDDPMRELLSQFVANHYPSLLRGDLEALLGAGGDLTRDVGQKVSRCMSAQRAKATAEKMKAQQRLEHTRKTLEATIRQRDETIRWYRDGRP